MSTVKRELTDSEGDRWVELSAGLWCLHGDPICASRTLEYIKEKYGPVTFSTDEPDIKKDAPPALVETSRTGLNVTLNLKEETAIHVWRALNNYNGPVYGLWMQLGEALRSEGVELKVDQDA